MVLGGTGVRDDDSSLTSYFGIDAKGPLVDLSGHLDCIPAETVNKIRCFISEGVLRIEEGRIMACMKHFRRLGQVIDVNRGAHRCLNLLKPREKKLFRENKRWDSVNGVQLLLESLQVIGMGLAWCACRSS